MIELITLDFLESLSPLISIDRRTPLAYPSWVEKPLYPELEANGPKKIDVSKLWQWLHPEQEDGWTKGTVVHNQLKTNNLLPTCCGLYELEAIRAKGIDFFCTHFLGKSVFGWKGVVQHRVVMRRDYNLYVPSLIACVGGPALFWRCLVDGFGARNPALRLK